MLWWPLGGYVGLALWPNCAEQGKIIEQVFKIAS